MDGIFEFQNEGNTVKGTVELCDKISEKAESGTDEIILYVEDATEDNIKNITENMGLFWGIPTGYTILKADADENTLKVKFYIEQTSNYYVIKNFLNDEPIPEDQTEALAISKELKAVFDDVIKDDMSEYQKELAIHDWLVNNVEYDKSIDARSTGNGSYGAMVSKKTMCRGYAEAVMLFSECAGLETRIVVGTATDEEDEEVGHAWNIIKLDDKWYHLDVTYDDPINDSNKNIHYYYFNLNDTDMAKDHSWNKDYFPICENDSYMYYKKNDLYYADMDQFRSEVSEAIKYDKPKYVEVLVDTNKIYESQLRFVFNAGSIKSFSWTAHSESPVILTIVPDYY